MLNCTVVMPKPVIFFIVLLFLVWGASPAMVTGAPIGQQEEPPPVEILNPHVGQIIQGLVPISVKIDAVGFQSAQLDFGYEGDETQTWFLLSSSDRQDGEEPFAQWDTTTITDGDYRLRLTVRVSDGEPLVAMVSGLRVRNYTPYATDTSTPTATSIPGDTPVPSATPTPTETPHPPTLTPLPTNPAVLSEATVYNSLGRGALFTLMVFCVLGLYFGLRILLRLRQ
jgi:hypothetical protein